MSTKTTSDFGNGGGERMPGNNLKATKVAIRAAFALSTSSPMAEPRITIIDLARAAGVSKMTVSRALRGEKGIAVETQQRIRALAEKLGYRPDPAVSELMGRLRISKTTGLEPLAWLTNYKTIGGWRSNPGTLDMYNGAVAQAHQMGYRLDEFSLCTPGMSPRRLSNILYSQSIRGVVLAPLFQHGEIKDFTWEHFAVACCGPSLLDPKLHRVAVDQWEVLRVAWRELTACGYKRIGFCISENDNNRFGGRWEGLYHVKSRGVPAKNRVPIMLTDEWNQQSFLRWYRAHRPDVVVSLIEVYHWMLDAGIRIPDECGFALLRLDQAKDVAGIDHRYSAVGASAVTLVASELSTNQYGIPKVRKTVAVECAWVPGPTVRPSAPVLSESALTGS